jgi:hypothetical protein
MTTRKFLVTSLEKLNHRPTAKNEKDYAFHAKKLMIEKFKINQSEISNEDDAKIEKAAKDFTYKVKCKYVESYYNYDLMIGTKSGMKPRLKLKNEKWLAEIIKNPIEKPSPSVPKKGRKPKNKRGPKTKPYNENKAGGTQQWKKASESNKKKDYSLEQLIHMTLLKATKTGNKDCAWVMKLLKADPEVNASELRDKYENPVKPVIVLTPKECLAEILQNRWTERQYVRNRKKQKACRSKMFVSYHQVLVAKKECAPKG